VLVGVAVFPMLFPGNGDRNLPPTPPTEVKADRKTLVPAGSHIRGLANAPFTLVEFGDYQCPTCASSVPIVEKALKTYKDKLNMVFYPYKLGSAHRYSSDLAAAVVAAAEQGKYWEMHDQMFKDIDKYQEIDPEGCNEQIIQTAKDMKLDIDRFKRVLGSADTAMPYQKARSLGDGLRVMGTPTFFFLTPTRCVMLHNAKQMVDYLNTAANWK